MLNVEHLSLTYPAAEGETPVLQDVTMQVAAGEVIALVGESGAGKSTVGAAVAGLLPPSARVLSGSIHYKGKDLLQLSEADYVALRGTEIASVFQNPMITLNPRRRIGRQMCETLEFKQGMQRDVALHLASEYLGRMGLADPAAILRAYPQELSGGMLQRVIIATALSCSPKLVVADEPTTALDAGVRAEIVDLIKRAAVDMDLGVLLITHDIAVVRRVADYVYVMRHGEVVEQGRTDSILRSPHVAYTQGLIQAVPPNAGRLQRFHDADEHAGHTVTGLANADTGDGDRPQQGLQSGITLEAVSVGFERARALFSRSTGPRVQWALDDVSLHIAPGSVFGIVGGSGSGKTTLARVIAGLQRPTRGEVQLDGVPVAAAGTAQHAVGAEPSVQMVFQNPFGSLNPRHRIRRQLVEAALAGGCSDPEQAYTTARELIEAVGLCASDLERYPNAFSGGQLQRLSIARALAGRPAVLLCDEPTAALDVTVQASVLNLLKDLQTALGITIVFISHDLNVCRHMCDTLAVLDQGKLVEFGDALDVLDRPQHAFTQQLVATAAH